MKDQYIISQLRQKIRSLENDKKMLEKKLKFKDILGNMRSSNQLQDNDLFNLKKQMLDLQRENQKLKTGKTNYLEKVSQDEEIKIIKKRLRNQEKIHQADLGVLSSLQLVWKSI